MKLVFVHGVANRRELNPHQFDENVQTRNEFFGQFLGIDPATIRNPYWGKFGGTDAYNGNYIPSRAAETFGASGTGSAFAGDPSLGFGDSGSQLLKIALADQTKAVDFIMIGAQN